MRIGVALPVAQWRKHALRAIFLGGAMLFSPPGFAVTCTVGASAFNFGIYDTINQLDVSNNTITLRCRRGGSPNGTYSVTIALSSGPGTYAARQMAGGGDLLLYNVYTAAARTTVWGDGSSGTGIVTQVFTFTNNANQLRTVQAHGRIPGNQTVRPATYQTVSAITVTVTF